MRCHLIGVSISADCGHGAEEAEEGCIPIKALAYLSGLLSTQTVSTENDGGLVTATRATERCARMEFLERTGQHRQPAPRSRRRTDPHSI